MPAARRKAGAVEVATKRDMARLPKDLAESSLAASAVALARELDGPSSATSKSMCAKAHLELMDRLRELAPPVQQEDDALDRINNGRVLRLASAGGSASPDS